MTHHVIFMAAFRVGRGSILAAQSWPAQQVNHPQLGPWVLCPVTNSHRLANSQCAQKLLASLVVLSHLQPYFCVTEMMLNQSSVTGGQARIHSHTVQTQQDSSCAAGVGTALPALGQGAGFKASREWCGSVCIHKEFCL